MAEDFPLMPVVSGGPPGPLEGSTTSAPGLGRQDTTIGQTFRSAYYNSPVVTLLNRGIGSLEDSTPVSHDDAVTSLKAQNFDTAFVPKEGMSHGALRREAERQAAAKLNDLQRQRAGGGSFVSNLAGGVAAGIADPSSIIIGPAAAEVMGLARVGMVGRAAIGGAVGAGFVGGMEAGQAHVTGHDEDIGSWSMMRDMTFGAAFGGLTHTAFGPRPLAPGNIEGHLNMIRAGEATAAVSRRTGVPINLVKSSADAWGEFQVTEKTGRAYGYSVEDLKDPVKNREAATKILTDLDRRFRDPEAVAVGYNAGPRWARRFLQAGKDRSILPKETQDYLRRIDQTMGRDTFGRAAPAYDIDLSTVRNPGEAVEEGQSQLSDATKPTYAPYDYALARNPQDDIDLAHIALSQFAADEYVDVYPFKQPIYQRLTGGDLTAFRPKTEAEMRFEKGGDLYKFRPGAEATNAAARENMRPKEAQVAESASAYRARSHEDEVSDIYAQAYKAATPWEQRLAEFRQSQEGSTKLRPEEKEQLDRLDAFAAPAAEAEVSPEVAAHRQYVADAKSQFAGMDEAAQERLTNEIAAEHAALEPETQMTHDELTKAVETAVKCGVMKGVDYGVD